MNPFLMTPEHFQLEYYPGYYVPGHVDKKTEFDTFREALIEAYFNEDCSAITLRKGKYQLRRSKFHPKYLTDTEKQKETPPGISPNREETWILHLKIRLQRDKCRDVEIKERLIEFGLSTFGKKDQKKKRLIEYFK